MDSWSMGTSAADKKILTFNDVVLRQSDLHILSGPHFLNDRIIEFYFSYLSSSHSSQSILLVPPSIAFWIINCPDMDSLKDFLEPLKFAEKDLVLFSVNDNEDVTLAEGGSHWSLLVYDKNANVFVHHDSNHGMNKRYARKLYTTIVKFMGASDREVKYIELTDSPQQVNGYDCGLYVIATAKVVCCWNECCSHDNRDALWISDVKEEVTPSAVAEMRKEILQLIKGLMADQTEVSMKR